MTLHAGQCPATQAFPGANREERTARFLSPKMATREALKIFAARGISVRPGEVRTLVKEYIRGEDAVSRDELEAYLYATFSMDPTGVTAVRNVDRARSRS